MLEKQEEIEMYFSLLNSKLSFLKFDKINWFLDDVVFSQKEKSLFTFFFKNIIKSATTDILFIFVVVIFFIFFVKNLLQTLKKILKKKIKKKKSLNQYIHH
jgi:hypothetical protein